MGNLNQYFQAFTLGHLILIIGFCRGFLSVLDMFYFSDKGIIGIFIKGILNGIVFSLLCIPITFCTYCLLVRLFISVNNYGEYNYAEFIVFIDNLRITICVCLVISCLNTLYKFCKKHNI